MNTVSAFIDALGGAAETARLFDVGASAVSNWKGADRLPLRLHLQVHQVCRAKGLAVPEALFLAPHKRTRGEAA